MKLSFFSFGWSCNTLDQGEAVVTGGGCRFNKFFLVGWLEAILFFCPYILQWFVGEPFSLYIPQVWNEKWNGISSASVWFDKFTIPWKIFPPSHFHELRKLIWTGQLSDGHLETTGLWMFEDNQRLCSLLLGICLSTHSLWFQALSAVQIMLAITFCCQSGKGWGIQTTILNIMIIIWHSYFSPLISW